MDELFGEAEVDGEGKLNYEVSTFTNILMCDNDDDGDDWGETLWKLLIIIFFECVTMIMMGMT